MDERMKPQEALNAIEKVRAAPLPDKKDWHCAVYRRPEQSGIRDDYVFWVPDYVIPISHTQDGPVDAFTFISPAQATVMMHDGRAGGIREQYTFMIELPGWFNEGQLTFEPHVDLVVTALAEPQNLPC